MKKCTPQQQRVLKTVHLLAAACWFGGAVSLLMLYFAKSGVTDGGELIGFNTAGHWIDTAVVVVPGAFGCLITGLLYGLFTGWGFFRHRWIIFKWVATVAMILFGMTCLGPWEERMLELSRQSGLAALQMAAYLDAERMNFIFGVVQAVLLACVVGISVFKPWRKPRT